MNRLAHERSPYLKHASRQKIDWYPWTDEAFERARREDKPLFLSSGAAWCHWCHVMAKECFYDEEVARLLNENFIAIKLDRDERPDIDRRYQKAVTAMGVGGGWPLTVFLTPERKAFFGGTYFPPEDVSGRPGFKKVLRAIIELYHSNRDEVEQYTEKLAAFIKPGPTPPGELRAELADDGLSDILSAFDPQNGGFGAVPKFPLPGALSFLINRYFFTGHESLAYAAKETLEAMARGGFCDQIGGGFHRYSVDEAWIVPHFEKMADDNAWLLRNYTDAYSVFGDRYLKEAAEGITGFVGEVLSDPDGGFYASQDADVTPDDEGGYFTWTEEEFRNALDAEEFRILSSHLFHERGTMHHDPSRRVLFIAKEAEEIARENGMTPEAVREIIGRAKAKLLAKRKERESPFIDRTLYTSLNGMMITAYLKASRVLESAALKDFALKSLRRIMRDHFTGGALFHTEGVRALLDDYVYLTGALVAAYEETGDAAWLAGADGMMELCLENFWDKEGGGFFDTDAEVLGMRLKGIEDIPHPSANASAVMVLLALAHSTGKDTYRDHAERALKAFAPEVEGLGVHAGSYFCAVDAWFRALGVKIEAAPGSELAHTAVSTFRPYKSVVFGEDKNRVIPCRREACYEPIESPSELRAFLGSGK